MGEWHQRPRCRELPKGRTTFGSGCLGYFCLAELSEGLRKSQDRRGAGHAPALSYESAWEADRACLGIYSRGSVWASGFARNEPCLPGCVKKANRSIVEFRLRATTPASSVMTPLTPPSAAPSADLLAVAQSKAVPPASGVSGFDMGLSPPTPPAFNSPGQAFSLLSMSSPAMPAPVTPEGVFGPMPVGGASDYDSCPDDSGYPSGDYEFCSDNSGKLSIPDGRVKATASMELSHLRGQRGRYASSDEQRHWQRQTSSLRKGVSVAEAAKRSSIASIGGKFAYASSTAGGVCWGAHCPSYATTSRCREPSASAITRCYVGSIRFRGVGTWFLSGLRAEGCACSLDGWRLLH